MVTTTCPRARCRAEISANAICCADCWHLIPVAIRRDLDRPRDDLPTDRYTKARTAAIVALRRIVALTA